MAEVYIALIEEALAKAIAGEDIPEGLRESMAYSLLAGGKRLRPRMCLACCAMLKGSVEDALPLACGIEMIHAYSLIHDDLPCMDDDDFRRGKPSSHKVFGEAGAVLAGDALMSHAFEWMLTHAPDEPDKLYNYVLAMRAIVEGAGARGMVAGQSLELSGALERGEVSIEEVHRRKTGALICAAALAGGHAAGGSGNELRALAAFAQAYGALFQIADDISDSRAETGDGKNYVCVHGIDAARALAHEMAEEASEALAPFGMRAQYLLDMVGATLRGADELP